MFTLLRGARVFAPEELGQRDVLLCGGKIVSLAERVAHEPGEGWGLIEIVDLPGRILAPGFMDSHLHFIGGGGSQGPASRTPEILLSSITRWGITTAVGCLGLDSEAKHIETLLAKAQALEAEGITTYLYDGCFKSSLATLLDNPRADLMLIEKIIGVKTSLGDSRDPRQSSLDLARIASDAVAGGLLGGKAGVIHIHLNRVPNPDPYVVLAGAMEISGVAPTRWVPTHVNWSERLLLGAIEFATAGTYLDVSGILSPSGGEVGAVEPEDAIVRLLEAGVARERLTVSTDGNASTPRLDPRTVRRGPYELGTATLLKTIRRLVEGGMLPLDQALELVTSNVATQLGLSGSKGAIKPGADADLVVLTEDLSIDRVYARGRLMVAGGVPVVVGMYELLERLDARGEPVPAGGKE